MYNVNNTHIKYCRCMTSGIKIVKYLILTSIHICLKDLAKSWWLLKNGFEYSEREQYSEKLKTPIDKIYL